MPTPAQLLFEAMGERLDEDLLPAVFAAASVPTAEVRAWLQAEGLPYLDPEAGVTAPLDDVATAAKRIVSQAQSRAAALGVVSGLGGAVAVPPEVLATLIHVLRMGQRLGVMFGFDPETDRGRVLLWRALAAAWEFELPDQGAVGLRVRDLPDALRAQLPASRQASAWLAKQIVWRSFLGVAGRLTRAVPGLGAGIAGWSGYRRTEAMGQRMIEVYRRAADATDFDFSQEELAVEVG